MPIALRPASHASRCVDDWRVYVGSTILSNQSSNEEEPMNSAQPSIEIREACVSDAPALAALHVAASVVSAAGVR